MVPTTTIGGAPGAWIGATLPTGGTGQNVHGSPSHTVDAPKCGATRAARAARAAATAATVGGAGASMQPIA